MTKKQKKMLLRILVSAALMVGLLFVPATGWLRFALWLVPYLIIGWDILSLMTWGFLDIFFVGPYKASTDAALYETLKYGIDAK